jgi:hypothetical protein
VHSFQLIAAELGLMELPSGAWTVLERMHSEANLLVANIIDTVRTQNLCPVPSYRRNESFWVEHPRYREARVPAAFHRKVMRRLDRELQRQLRIRSTPKHASYSILATAFDWIATVDGQFELPQALYPLGPELVGEYLSKARMWW